MNTMNFFNMKRDNVETFIDSTPQTSTPLKQLMRNFLSNASAAAAVTKVTNTQQQSFSLTLLDSSEQQPAHDDLNSYKTTRFLGSHAVSVLNKWFNENREYPYPDDAITDLLAQEANISSKQVKKWFANKRVRSQACFKPMHRARKRSSNNNNSQNWSEDSSAPCILLSNSSLSTPAATLQAFSSLQQSTAQAPLNQYTALSLLNSMRQQQQQQYQQYQQPPPANLNFFKSMATASFYNPLVMFNNLFQNSRPNNNCLPPANTSACENADAKSSSNSNLSGAGSELENEENNNSFSLSLEHQSGQNDDTSPTEEPTESQQAGKNFQQSQSSLMNVLIYLNNRNNNEGNVNSNKNNKNNNSVHSLQPTEKPTSPNSSSSIDNSNNISPTVSSSSPASTSSISSHSNSSCSNGNASLSKTPSSILHNQGKKGDKGSKQANGDGGSEIRRVSCEKKINFAIVSTLVD